MIMTGCANIRELLGHKCSIEWIESQPAVRLDKSSQPKLPEQPLMEQPVSG
jgi:hypothetical protein